MTPILAGVLAVFATLAVLPQGAAAAEPSAAPDPSQPDLEKYPAAASYDEKCRKLCAPQYTALLLAERDERDAIARELESDAAKAAAEKRLADLEGKIDARQKALDNARARMNDKSQNLKSRQQAAAEAKALLGEIDALRAQEPKLTDELRLAEADLRRASTRSREATNNRNQKIIDYFDCLKKCKKQSGKPTALLIGAGGGGLLVAFAGVQALSGGDSADGASTPTTSTTTTTTTAPAPATPTCTPATGTTTATLSQDACGGFGGFMAPVSLTCIGNRATIELGDRIPRRYTGEFATMLNLAGAGPFNVPGVTSYEGVFTGSTSGNATTGRETFSLIATNGARCAITFNHTIQWNR